MRPNSKSAKKERECLILSQKQQQIDLILIFYLIQKIMLEKDKKDMKIEGINNPDTDSKYLWLFLSIFGLYFSPFQDFTPNAKGEVEDLEQLSEQDDDMKILKTMQLREKSKKIFFLIFLNLRREIEDLDGKVYVERMIFRLRKKVRKIIAFNILKYYL